MKTAILQHRRLLEVDTVQVASAFQVETKDHWPKEWQCIDLDGRNSADL